MVLFAETIAIRKEMAFKLKGQLSIFDSDYIICYLEDLCIVICYLYRM